MIVLLGYRGISEHLGAIRFSIPGSSSDLVSDVGQCQVAVILVPSCLWQGAV